MINEGIRVGIQNRVMEWRGPLFMERFNRIRKVAAWAGIVILAGLYLITFILGVFGNEATDDLFKACVVCTVLVPVLFYAMLLFGRSVSGRDNSGQGKDSSDRSGS